MPPPKVSQLVAHAVEIRFHFMDKWEWILRCILFLGCSHFYCLIDIFFLSFVFCVPGSLPGYLHYLCCCSGKVNVSLTKKMLTMQSRVPPLIGWDAQTHATRSISASGFCFSNSNPPTSWGKPLLKLQIISVADSDIAWGSGVDRTKSKIPLA